MSGFATGVNRTILVHVNVTVPDADQRTADQIATWVEQGLEKGLAGGRVKIAPPSHMVTIALAEEI